MWRHYSVHSHNGARGLIPSCLVIWTLRSKNDVRIVHMGLCRMQIINSGTGFRTEIAVVTINSRLADLVCELRFRVFGLPVYRKLVTTAHIAIVRSYSTSRTVRSFPVSPGDGSALKPESDLVRNKPSLSSTLKAGYPKAMSHYTRK